MNAFSETFRRLGPSRLLTLAGVTIGFVAFFAFLVSRLSGPEMSLLYSDLDTSDSGKIIAKLDAQAIPYELRGNGTQIYVPSDRVLRLRMGLAEEGMPSGGSVGYELFDKADALGTTNFVQNVNWNALSKANSRVPSVRSTPSNPRGSIWSCRAVSYSAANRKSPAPRSS